MWTFIPVTKTAMRLRNRLRNSFVWFVEVVERSSLT